MEVNRTGGNSKPEPPPARGSQRARTVDFNAPSSFNPNPQGNAHLGTRKLIVPQYNPRDPSQITYTDGTRDTSLSSIQRSASSASARSLPHRLPPSTASSKDPPPQVLRKPVPPPIPTKKPSLNSIAIPRDSSTSSSTSTPRYRDDPSPLEDERRRYPQPPPARRSMAAPPAVYSSAKLRKPIPNLIDGDDDGRREKKPALPPRTGTGLSGRDGNGYGYGNGSGNENGRGRSLMDNEPEPEELEGFRGWEVLRPVK